MDFLKQTISDYIWLLTRWYFWLTFLVVILLSWYLFSQRTYKEVDGRLLIRHGHLGEWEDLEEHFKREHPIEWTLLQKSEKEENKKE